MIDKSVIGFQAPDLALEIERGRLRLFCKAIGETGAVFTDVRAARAAGHPDVIAPPTFPFCLDSDRADGFSMTRALGLPLARLLHGSQSMVHHGQLSAGDRVMLRSHVADVYEKKGGALEFVVIQSHLTREGSGEKLVDLERVLIVRNPAAEP